MNAIKSLESLPGVISHDKASILLVHGNLKPSALIVMEGPAFRDLMAPEHITLASLDTLNAIFSELSLSSVKKTEIMEAKESGSYVEVVRFFIARDISTAEKLKLLFDTVSVNHAEIGRLLGYPETAVTAFLTPRMLNQADTPTSTKEVSELNMRLLGHRLSKDNWQEEVKYLERSGEYIKSISPVIYDLVTAKE